MCVCVCVGVCLHGCACVGVHNIPNMRLSGELLPAFYPILATENATSCIIIIVNQPLCVRGVQECRCLLSLTCPSMPKSILSLLMSLWMT